VYVYWTVCDNRMPTIRTPLPSLESATTRTPTAMTIPTTSLTPTCHNPCLRDPHQIVGKGVAGLLGWGFVTATMSLAAFHQCEQQQRHCHLHHQHHRQTILTPTPTTAVRPPTNLPCKFRRQAITAETIPNPTQHPHQHPTPADKRIRT